MFMTAEKVIPIFRIFDYNKAVEFYIDWLGFEIEWEHMFEEGMPKYIQIKREGITLHLSENHGDTTPGTRIYVECTGLKEYHKELIEKKYKYNKPGLKKT